MPVHWNDGNMGPARMMVCPESVLASPMVGVPPAAMVAAMVAVPPAPMVAVPPAPLSPFLHVTMGASVLEMKSMNSMQRISDLAVNEDYRRGGRIAVMMKRLG